MRFGFDIDDTLIKLREHAFHIYNKKLNQNVPLHIFQEIKKIEIHDVFGLTAEQGKEMWKNSMEEIYFTSCPAYPNAIEILQDLSEQGHEIFYITARPKEHGERTKRWMIETGFPVHPERFYCGMQDHEKVQIIEQLKLDYYVDDKPTVLNTLNHDEVKVLVKDQSYNQNLNVPRIREWTDLQEIMRTNTE